MAAVRPAEGYRVMETLIASARSGWPLTSSMPVMGALSTAPASARAHVRVTLSGWQLGEMTEFAEVVVSEAVTNAVNASTVRSGQPVYIDGRMAVIGLLQDKIEAKVRAAA